MRSLAIATAVLVLCGLLFFFVDPASSGVYWSCPFHTLTGLYCPGCGAQRALHAVLHGRVIEALSLNALVVLVFLPWGIYGYAAYAAAALGIARIPAIGINPRRLQILLTLVILFGVLRNIPVAPLSWLGP